jgi:hypothetical protein
MVVLNGGIALLMAFNLAVNTAVGLLILARCPHVMCWRDKPDLKAEEKGGTEHEQSVD